MHSTQAQIIQTALDAERAARLHCPAALIPAPGQYVLAHAATDSHAPLAVPLFAAAHHSDGFTAAGPLPSTWTPGTNLHLRGPLGRGFKLPSNARAIGLLALDVTPARLLPLIALALARGASVSLACAGVAPDLPPAVEVMGLSAAPDIAAWCDCLIVDTPRALLPNLTRLLGNTPIPAGSQVLVFTPLPCGSMGECGACAVNLRRGWALACKDGPVLALKELLF